MVLLSARAMKQLIVTVFVLQFVTVSLSARQTHSRASFGTQRK